MAGSSSRSSLSPSTVSSPSSASTSAWPSADEIVVLPATPVSLSPNVLAILRSRLEMQREFRLDQVAALDSYPAEPTPGGIAHAEVRDTLRRGAVSALRDVQAALGRLDEGCFGRCVTCGREVELERLASVPQAASCERCHHPG